MDRKAREKGYDCVGDTVRRVESGDKVGELRGGQSQVEL